MTQRATQRPGTTSDHGWRQPNEHVLAVGLICILVALAYANSLWNDFTYDDRAIIQENTLIRRLGDIPTLFTTHYWEGASVFGQEYSLALYRPFVLTTYTLNYLTSGPAPWAFHLTNILIHLGVVLTLYGIACRLALSWSGALVTALVFAVHPLNTEAVTGIVGRAELLMTLGVVMAFYWDLGKNAVQQRVTKLSLASVAAFALGLLSKEQAIMLPGLLIVADAMRGDDVTERRRWRIFWDARFRYLGYLMVAGFYLVTRTAVVGITLPQPSNVANPLSVIDPTLSLINAVKVAGTYLWLTVWPANLSADYSYNAIALTNTPLDPTVWVSALAWILLLALGVVAIYQHRRPMAIGIAMMFLFFLPVANLAVHIGTIMGERLFYLPLAGLCLVLGTGWDSVARLVARSASNRSLVSLGVGVAILSLVPLTARTITRNRDWENNATLFSSMVHSQPGSARAHFLMAGIHHERGELDDAHERFEAALTILPRYLELPAFAQHYGRLLTDLGRADEAVAVMEAAIRANPERKRNPFIYRALARAHERNEALALAAAARERAIEITASIPGTSAKVLVTDYGQLARLYTLQGRTADGQRALMISLDRVGKDQRLAKAERMGMTAQILGNLALIDTLENNDARAEQRYLQALGLLESPLLVNQKPMRIARLRDYARLLRKMGRPTAAAAIDKQAASLGSH